jgi:hypothetical protein
VGRHIRLSDRVTEYGQPYAIFGFSGWVGALRARTGRLPVIPQSGDPGATLAAGR